MRGSHQLADARAVGPPRPQSPPTRPARPAAGPDPRFGTSRAARAFPAATASARIPGPGPPPPCRLADVRGCARRGPSRGRRRAAPFLPGKAGTGRRPPPAGPFGRRPAGPLTLHHLLRLLLSRAALRRHVGCSSPFRYLSPQAPQPMRVPSSELCQPMESHTLARRQSLMGVVVLP